MKPILNDEQASIVKGMMPSEESRNFENMKAMNRLVLHKNQKIAALELRIVELEQCLRSERAEREQAERNQQEMYEQYHERPFDYYVKKKIASLEQCCESRMKEIVRLKKMLGFKANQSVPGYKDDPATKT